MLIDFEYSPSVFHFFISNRFIFFTILNIQLHDEILRTPMDRCTNSPTSTSTGSTNAQVQFGILEAKDLIISKAKSTIHMNLIISKTLNQT